MYAVRLILEELRLGRRAIMTNVPLHIGRLNEYVQSEYPRNECNVVGRVHLMTEEQTGEFWRYRPRWTQAACLTKDQWRSGLKPSFAGIEDSGVMYVIDEIHNFFGARQWAETGQDALYYLSQHRKLGDDVVCITQSVQNVDTQFRRVAQDYTYLKNLSKVKLGIMRMPSLFVRRTYPEPITGGNTTMECLETGTFRLDVRGLGTLYDTAAGVGIHGRAADVGERKKGMNWIVAAVLVSVVIGALFMTVPKMLAGAFSQTGIIASNEIGRRGTNAPVPALAVPVASGGVVKPAASVGALPGPSGVTNRVWWVGRGWPDAYFLSDGRTIRQRDIRAVSSRQLVLLSGGVLEWR